jgi:hypothetical protein
VERDRGGEEDVNIANHVSQCLARWVRPAVLLLQAVALLSACQAVALSPPAPPPPTLAQTIENAQAVFIGRVESVKWTPILAESRDAGTISMTVKVTDLLLGDTREVPTRVVYVAGRASMSEAQAKARYEGHVFVFAGIVNRPRGGQTEIVIPPSGDPPLEMSTLPEVMREITRLEGISGPQDNRPGIRNKK